MGIKKNSYGALNLSWKLCKRVGGGGGGEMRERKSFLSGERRSVLLLISTRQQISREHEGGRKGDHRIKPDFIAHAKFLWIPPQSLVPRSPRLPRWTKICTGEEKLINNLIQCKNEFLSVGRSERPSSQRGFLFSFFFSPSLVTRVFRVRLYEIKAEFSRGNRNNRRGISSRN